MKNSQRKWVYLLNWFGEIADTMHALSNIVQLVMKISAGMKKSVEKSKEDEVHSLHWCSS